MRLWVASCLVVVAALFHGPSTARAESDLSELAGTFWRVDRLDGTSHDTSSIVVHISRFMIGFSVPCEAQGYPLSYVSGSLKIEPSAASSRGSCQAIKSPAKSPVMAAVEATLPRITGHTVKADVLTLLDNQSRPVLALSRITATGLENQEWSVDQYSDGVNLVTATRKATVTFVHNVIDGSPGCGWLWGRYSLSGAHLKTWVSWLLAGSCPGDLEPQSNGIAKALSGERTVERDNRRIILRDDRGAIQAVLID